MVFDPTCNLIIAIFKNYHRKKLEKIEKNERWNHLENWHYGKYNENENYADTAWL